MHSYGFLNELNVLFVILKFCKKYLAHCCRSLIELCVVCVLLVFIDLNSNMQK